MTNVPQFHEDLQKWIVEQDEELDKIMDELDNLIDKVEDGKRLTKSEKIKFHDGVMKFYATSKEKGKRNYLPWGLVHKAFNYAVDRYERCFFTTSRPMLEFTDDTAMSTFQFGELTFDVYGTRFKCNVSWEDEKVTERSWKYPHRDVKKWSSESSLCDVGSKEELIFLAKQSQL